MTSEPTTVPCETCGEATRHTGTRHCNDCWEVESRLASYLRRGGTKARSFVHAALDATRGKS